MNILIKAVVLPCLFISFSATGSVAGRLNISEKHAASQASSESLAAAKAAEEAIQEGIVNVVTPILGLLASPMSSNGENDSCRSITDQCWDFCDQVMSDKNGGVLLTSSDKERCGWRCGDAGNACENGETNKTKQYLCEAKCEMLINDDGGFFSESSRGSCKTDCFVKFM